MDPLIMTVLTAAISAIVGALVSSIITSARSATGRSKAMEEGMKTLLKAELFALHHRYVELDEPLDAMGLQLAATTYACYHDGLGGNGLGTRLYEQIAEKGIEG